MNFQKLNVNTRRFVCREEYAIKREMYNSMNFLTPSESCHMLMSALWGGQTSAQMLFRPKSICKLLAVTEWWQRNCWQSAHKGPVTWSQSPGRAIAHCPDVPQVRFYPIGVPYLQEHRSMCRMGSLVKLADGSAPQKACSRALNTTKLIKLHF